MKKMNLRLFVAILTSVLSLQCFAAATPAGLVKQVTTAAKIIASADEENPSYLQQGEFLLQALRNEFDKNGKKSAEFYTELNVAQVPVFATLIRFAKAADVETMLNLKMFLLDNTEFIFGEEQDDISRAIESLQGVLSKDSSVKEKIDIALKWAGAKGDLPSDVREAAIQVIENL